MPKKKAVRIRLSLFFDGTLNNRCNTSARLSGNATEDELSHGSFQNDYSNVAKLEWSLARKSRGFDLAYGCYVEGIGTLDREGDSLMAAATGMGPWRSDTGVTDKVRLGVKWALATVRRRKRSTEEIKDLHIDVFGFSRGAAAARHFVHKAIIDESSMLRKQIAADGYSIGEVKISFVGRFDTVASYGVIHWNDTRDLDLDAVAKADKVIQLAAAEEHRANFRLTDIKSAIREGKGKQVFLPGVHSDIGGGYVDEEPEKRGLRRVYIDGTILSAAMDRRMRESLQGEAEWFKRQGWLTEAEVTINRESTLEGHLYTLRSERSSVRNTYSLIPLHLMAEFATQSGIGWNADLRSKYAVPPDLKAWLDALRKYALDGANSTPQDWFDKVSPPRGVAVSSSDLRRLRHDYLHISTTEDGSTVEPNKPQRVDGRRARVIQDG